MALPPVPAKIVNWLRAGYPEGVPGTDYIPLFAVLRHQLTESLDVCDISGACEQLRQFTEALTNWYVRRSRSRFWEEDVDAIDTLDRKSVV